jgi:molecular chaperone GrpE (heat shock protein)
MSSSKIMNDKIVRVSDILEQIDELNRMIEIHSDDAENSSMLSQYQFVKEDFVKELNSILQDFQLGIKAV